MMKSSEMSIRQSMTETDEHILAAQVSHHPEATVKLGILGCSGIVPRAVLDPAPYVDGLEIVGVANRTLSKAESLAEHYGIATIYNSLDELLADPQLDAVYIGLSNELHATWIRKALSAGKHVLVEKPLCLYPEELPIMSAAAQHYGLQLIEGLMVAHHPWQHTLRELIQSGEYGNLIRTVTQLTIPAKDNHQDNYRSHPEQGGGCFWDLGCYWLQFLQQVIGIQHSEFDGHSLFDGPNGCDWTFEAQARLAHGVTAEAIFSFEKPYSSRHVIYLEHATITINDFFRCNLGFYKLKLKIALLDNGQETGEVRYHTFEPMNYYVNQLRFFRDVIHHPSHHHSLDESVERIHLLSHIHATAKAKSVIS
ncbi:Gfo/Idh/MocA family protein [Paenibacillus nicotianae]|uniref:Gfo/Idh/MocA family protein n=2 Tax=Paenibacillus nicotianae TaxID=1526551 RepID=A0ABW4UY70_9BACL